MIKTRKNILKSILPNRIELDLFRPSANKVLISICSCPSDSVRKADTSVKGVI